MALWNVCRGIRIRSSFWLSQGLSYGERTKGLGFLWKSYAPWPSLSQRLHLWDILSVRGEPFDTGVCRGRGHSGHSREGAVEKYPPHFESMVSCPRGRGGVAYILAFCCDSGLWVPGENVFLWSELWLLIEDCWVHQVWNRTWLPLHTKTLSQNFLSALPAKWQFFSIFLGHLGHYY